MLSEQNHARRTALHFAAIRGNRLAWDVVRGAMEAAGVDTEVKDSMGMRAVDYLVRCRTVGEPDGSAPLKPVNALGCEGSWRPRHQPCHRLPCVNNATRYNTAHTLRTFVNMCSHSSTIPFSRCIADAYRAEYAWMTNAVSVLTKNRTATT